MESKTKQDGKRKCGRPKKKTLECVLVDFEKIDIKSFMSAPQKGGYELTAVNAYNDTKDWLRQMEVVDKVPDSLVMMYAMSLARWIQTEERVSKNGMKASHPTTGAPITSQDVKISMDYEKQARETWALIANIVKENTTAKKKAEEPSNSLMDLLKQRRDA